jgi:MFS family permease
MRTSGIFAGWKVVIGSGVGIAFGSAVFISTSFALVAAAIGTQFGWAQADLAKGASIFLLLQMLTYPVVGWLLDRFGSRRVAIASIFLFAMSLLALTQVGNAQWQYYLAFVLIGLVSAGTNVVSYARAITHWFDRKRGLALGIAASFQAIGSFILPNLVQKIIAGYGWPQAVAVLAAFEIIVCLPLVALLVKDDPHAYGLYPDGDDVDHAASMSADPIPTAGEILRSGTFWKLAICFAIMGMSIYAVVTNITFILTKPAGLTLAQVASVAGITGVSILFGRIGFGFLLDKFHAPVVGAVSLLLAAVYFAGMGTASSFGMLAVVAIIGGTAVGGESDLMPYLAGRYFNKRAVSKVFGWFLCLYFLGAAAGPVTFAWASAAFQGATIPLYAIAALQIVPVLIFLTLGPYPQPTKNVA